MKFEGNFRKYGQLDISALRVCVDRQSEDAWRADPFRQQQFAVHGDTETLYLIYDRDFRHANATRLPLFDAFAAALEPFIGSISDAFGGEGWVGRCILARLCAGGRVEPHKDQGFSLMRPHRFHIPVITNGNALFSVGDETVHMQPGEIWEINNGRRHGAVNLGAEPRVHLILDWARPLTEADLQNYVEGQLRRQQ